MTGMTRKPRKPGYLKRYSTVRVLAGISVSVLVGIAAVAISATDAPELRYDNSPDSLPVQATTPSSYFTEHVIEHSTGVTLVIADGSVRKPMPLLLDGVWELKTPGVRDTRLVIGDPRAFSSSTDPRELSETLLECWLGEGHTRPGRLPQPEGVRCTQSLIGRTAELHGYELAADAISLALSRLDSRDPLRGWYCGIAGEAAATGAVLYGDDPRTLMRTQQSFCDYSVFHGVGAGIVLRDPPNAVTRLTELCAPQTGSVVPEDSQESQCWHGGGISIARITGLDFEQGASYCEQAPSVTSVRNCAEGMFSFARTYLLRYDADDPRPARLLPTISGCHNLRGTENLLQACYRSVGQHLLRAEISANSSSYTSRARAVDSMRSGCAEVSPTAETEHHTSCWSGLGFLIGLSLHPDLGELSTVDQWVGTCAEAGTPDAVYGCYERALLGLLRNDQLKQGLEPRILLSLAPTGLQERLGRALADWSATLLGRSS